MLHKTAIAATTTAALFAATAPADIIRHDFAITIPTGYSNTDAAPVRTWQVPKIDPGAYHINSITYAVTTSADETFVVNAPAGGVVLASFGHRISVGAPSMPNILSGAFNFASAANLNAPSGIVTLAASAIGTQGDTLAQSDPRLMAFYGNGDLPLSFTYGHNRSTSDAWSFVSQRSDNVNTEMSLTFDVTPVPAPIALPLGAIMGMAVNRRRR